VSGIVFMREPVRLVFPRPQKFAVEKFKRMSSTLFVVIAMTCADGGGEDFF
jgi:hypothetical protein